MAPRGDWGPAFPLCQWGNRGRPAESWLSTPRGHRIGWQRAWEEAAGRAGERPPRRASAGGGSGGGLWRRAPSERSSAPLPSQSGAPQGSSRPSGTQPPAERGGWSRQTQGFPGGGWWGCRRRLEKRAEPWGLQKRLTSARSWLLWEKSTWADRRAGARWVVLRPVPACGGSFGRRGPGAARVSPAVPGGPAPHEASPLAGVSGPEAELRDAAGAPAGGLRSGDAPWAVKSAGGAPRPTAGSPRLPRRRGSGAWAGPAVLQLWTERWRGPRPR